MERTYDGLTDEDQSLLNALIRDYDGKVPSFALRRYLFVTAELLLTEGQDDDATEWLRRQMLKHERLMIERRFERLARARIQPIERTNRPRSLKRINGRPVMLNEVRTSEGTGRCGFFGGLGTDCVRFVDCDATMHCRICGPINAELCDSCMGLALKSFDESDPGDMIIEFHCTADTPGLHEIIQISEVTFR